MPWRKVLRRPNRWIAKDTMLTFIALVLVFANVINLPQQGQLDVEPETTQQVFSDYNNVPRKEITFEDIQFLRFLDSGAGKLGFKAKIRGRRTLFAAKIAGDRHLTDTEAQMMQILNTPPTIPNIPKVELYIPSIPNPFTNRTYFEKTLRLPRHLSEWLASLDTISVMVMEYLYIDTVHFLPRTFKEVRVFLRSLLQALQFAHSRNVMNRDLYLGNVYFDGTVVKLFDWDDGAIYKPNAVKIRVSRTRLKNPPEGWNNASALHPTISGYDVWNVGIIMRKLWPSVETPNDEKQVLLLKDFVEAALTEDPYKRPDASELLRHPFLADKTQEIAI
mmetsp:Transcript_26132/g.47186  ORF Transcript_26132/g.47186 Transcript_26132/m.47186 type:complete len:333 (+) Transcript_26132:203-1201(+)